MLRVGVGGRLGGDLFFCRVSGLCVMGKFGLCMEVLSKRNLFESRTAQDRGSKLWSR